MIYFYVWVLSQRFALCRPLLQFRFFEEVKASKVSYIAPSVCPFKIMGLHNKYCMGQSSTPINLHRRCTDAHKLQWACRQFASRTAAADPPHEQMRRGAFEHFNTKERVFRTSNGCTQKRGSSYLRPWKTPTVVDRIRFYFPEGSTIIQAIDTTEKWPQVSIYSYFYNSCLGLCKN